MFANDRAESLLEWKAITDQDAERYLLHSLLKKERWKGTGAETQEEKEEDRQGEVHTTKFTRHTEALKDSIEKNT